MRHEFSAGFRHMAAATSALDDQPETDQHRLDDLQQGAWICTEERCDDVEPIVALIDSIEILAVERIETELVDSR